MRARFPLAYWGSVSYYRSMIKEGNVAFEVHETYPKQTLRNRCQILTSGGVLPLSVTVSKPKGSRTTTGEIEISYAQDWALNHWRAIRTAYASAPYFEHYGPRVEQLLDQRFVRLTQLNLSIHEEICRWLDLPVITQLTENFQSTCEKDYLQVFNTRSSSEKWYQQVFTDRQTFESDLSVLDLIMNEGPMARRFLM